MAKNNTTITISQKDLLKYKKLREKVNKVFKERYKIDDAFSTGNFFGLIIMYIEKDIDKVIETLTVPDLSLEYDEKFIWEKTKTKAK